MSEPATPVVRAIGGRRVEVVWFTDVRRARVEWLLPGRIPLGMLSLVIGDPGLGKSLFTCLLSAQLSRGELGDVGASTTLFLTAEDSIDATIRPRLDATAAVRERIATYRLTTADGSEDGLTIPDDVDQLEQLIVSTTARLVVIDPLGGHLPGSINAWQDQSVRRALAPLARLADKHGCAVVAVLHLNKKESTDALRRINGSTGFGAAARSVLLFARDPDDPDRDHGRRRVLAHVKCNVAELAHGLLYEVESILSVGRARARATLVARPRRGGAHKGTHLGANASPRPWRLTEDRTDHEGQDRFHRRLGMGAPRATDLVQRRWPTSHRRVARYAPWPPSRDAASRQRFRAQFAARRRRSWPYV